MLTRRIFWGETLSMVLIFVILAVLFIGVAIIVMNSATIIGREERARTMRCDVIEQKLERWEAGEALIGRR